MGTLLDDLRWVREASTALRRMPDPFHHPEPWMNLLDNENEWSKALRQLDVKCSRPRKSEEARYMSDDQAVCKPAGFRVHVMPSDKRRCFNSAGALVSHQHRSHGYKNPFSRATVDDSCPACGKTLGTRAKALDHIAQRKRRRLEMKTKERRLLNWAAKVGLNFASTGMETCCTLCWDGCVTWLRCVFAGCVGYCWHESMCFVLPGKCHLSQGQPFAAGVGSMLVAWSSGACPTAIHIPFLVLFLEYAVLDDKANVMALSLNPMLPPV